MRKPKYRLSPNEVERIVKEETARKRKLRILQVREQAKSNAAVIRNDVRREKERLLNNLAEELKEQLNAEKGEKLRKLEEAYENTLRTVGEGHKEVHVHGDGQNKALRLKQKKDAELAAKERYIVALEKEKKDIENREYKENKHIYIRRAALDVERDRAAKVASLPPPPPDISVDLEKSQKKAIPMVDMKAFATTHYHIPEYQVVKADGEEQALYDAKAEAEDTDLKLKQDLQERRRALHEQAERARIRGNQALEKEILKHDYGNMLKDLSLLQRHDRRRRQQLVADLPKQVFIPAERCVEERKDRQNEMQQRFHQLYMDDHGIDCELQTTDVSDYASGLGSIGDSSLDAKASMIAGNMSPSRLQPSFRSTNEGAQTSQSNSVLKQLLIRIKEQRTTSATTSGQVTGRSQVADTGSRSHMTIPEVKEVGKVKAAWHSAPPSDPEHSDVGPTQYPPNEMSSKSSAILTPSLPIGLQQPPEPVLYDDEALRNNERLIEELRHRIECIESEKSRLNQQFQSRRAQLAEDGISPLKSDLAESTLREVDITCDTPTRDTIEDRPSLTPSPTVKGVQLLPDNFSGEDLSSTAANLRPLAGILKGSKDPQYELLTSNGFPPLPDVQQKTNKIDDGELSQVDSDGGLVGILKKQDQIDKKEDAAHSIKTTSSSAVPFGVLIGPSPQAQWLGIHQTNAQGTKEDLDERVRAYQADALQRHQQLGPDTVQRVRQYQQSLLGKDSQRRQMLANIRADIEHRRDQLMASHASSLSRASQNLYQGLTKQFADSVAEGSEVAEDVAAQPISQGPTALPSEIPSIKYDPKTWEPIKPFEADGLSGSKGHMEQQHDLNVTVKEDSLKNNGDPVKRSLMFEDIDQSRGQSPVVSWKNVLDDTGVSSVAAGDDSHITSSESRGSPTLRPGSGLEISSASNTSITGSSSLNGSALVARAEERRRGFELRQQELREQLAEIAQQKDSILQRYAASHGYQIVKDDQTRQGGQASQGSTMSYREQQELVRLKLAVVNAQLGAEGSTRRETLKPDHNSRRSSSGSGGSNPSYLEEISFQRIISPSQAPVMPASVFTSSQGKADFPLAKPDTENGHKLQTWASILSSSSNSSFDMQEDRKFDDSTMSKSSKGDTDTDHRGQDLPLTDTDVRGTQKTPEPVDPRPGQILSDSRSSSGLQSLTSVPPGAWAHMLTEHRPHELSTILEVDTPSSSARVISSGLPHRTLHSTSSSQSLSSSGGLGAQDPPLAAQEVTTGARRSLDFSDSATQQPATSFKAPWPIADIGSSGDLWSTPMPDLVELTPFKPSPEEEGGEQEDADLSSFKLSGYSDYLRAGPEVTEGAGVNSVDLCDESVNLTSIPSMSLNEVSLSNADHDNSKV